MEIQCLACWIIISADDILNLFLFFPENRLWHFKQIVSLARPNETICMKCQSPVFWRKKEKKKQRKIFQNVVCWNFYPPYKAIKTKYTISIYFTNKPKEDHIKWKSAFKHAQNVQSQIILHMCKVLCWHLLSNDTFYSICLCWGFMAQSTQWGHVERGQFT